MNNRVMRIIVMFDLPTLTKSDRHEASVFRNKLIKNGFFMVQLSVYCRITRNHDDARKNINVVKSFLPPEGSVRVLTLTEKQYASMQILIGEKTASESFLGTKDIMEL
ncbi:CRISPR-associated endonuclease Cas2 [Eubacteriaceae bacterium ES3]|nr:CRISPR-associated endonuclease Cas2 [Eubacteriaceae bacterium ES3]